MAKKQVAVSLRKPPSPEKIDAFVSSGGAEKATPSQGTGNKRSPSKQDGVSEPPKTAEAAVEPASPPAEPASPPAEPASPPAVAAASEPSANGASASFESMPLATTSDPPPILVGNDGRVRRSITVYLPNALADRLVLHCIELDRDLNNLVGEAIEVHLDRRLGPGEVAAAPPVDDTAAPREPSPSAAPPYRAEPFRGTDPVPPGKVDRFLQVGRVLVALWRQRPWGT